MYCCRWRRAVDLSERNSEEEGGRQSGLWRRQPSPGEEGGRAAAEGGGPPSAATQKAGSRAQGRRGEQVQGVHGKATHVEGLGIRV